MAEVLVTGATGMLGSVLVPKLVDRGHNVHALSRHPPADGPGLTGVAGDVLTGKGLATAADGVDTVIHAATSPRRRARRVEVEGTRHMLAAARDAGAHFLYVSIVGVDRSARFHYYRAKWAAEQLVAAHGGPWTILRATQFHPLMEMFLGFRVFPATKRMAFQPVDTGEVSDRLADLVEAGPSGRVDDFGGPEVLPIRDIEATRRRITGRRALLVRAPAIGPLRDFDAGRRLCPEHRQGRITWESWLRTTAGA